MCDSSTLKLGSTLVQAGGQLAGAFGQAGVSDTQAALVKRRATIEEARTRKTGKRLMGTQRAKFAKAGVRVAGTPTEVISQTAADIELEALMIRSNAMQEAAALKAGARDIRSAALIRTGGTLLGDLDTFNPPAPKIEAAV